MQKFSLKKAKLNKTKILMLVAIFTLMLFVGGATYAYFQNQTTGPTEGNLEIISNTVDNLMFNIEKEIYINANLNNFQRGMVDLSDDTDATATLIPNNYNNQATAMYNIYLIIETNDLEYTTMDHTPELLLNVTDPNGNKLENITGLVHYDNGFDITTRTGGFLIASDYVINASNVATVQTWNVEITLANLDSNQNPNMSKTFSAKLYLTQDKMSSYNPVQITSIEAVPTYSSIDTTLNLSNGTADVAKYYFGIKEASATEEVVYIEENNSNYTFNNLEENTEYIIYSYVEDTNGIKSNVYETNITTNTYNLPSVGEVSHNVTLNSITITVNDATDGDGTVEKYMYSNNNGESWIESDSNTYTFDNLTDTTEYKIKVKVVDSNGYESPEYYEAISTETYILPVVATVDATTTYDSITLTPSGTDGTNAINHYEYSINNGEYQTSNVFSNLNEQTQYTINVKAVDNAGRESNPYTIQITTDTYQVPIINGVTSSSTTSSFTLNVSASNGDGTITRYMYSRDNGSNWYESTSSSYTFSSLTDNTTFYIQVKAVDNNGRESSVYSGNVRTLMPIAEYVTNLYSSDGTNSLYLHNGSGTYGSSEAGDNSYRYTGANPNNYVCFGTNATTCPAEYLYRIIGVFGNQVKLIQAESGTPTLLGTNGEYTGTAVASTYEGTYKGTLTTLYGYGWDKANQLNTWSRSQLNTINLNTNFINNIGSTWASKIATTNWKVGGISWQYGEYSNAKNVYNYEVGLNSSSTTYSAKIGLMYLSDYYYAASPTYWSYPGYNSSTGSDYSLAFSNNWMAVGFYDWTITRVTDQVDYYLVFGVDNTGEVRANIGYSSIGVRAAFYLNSNVGYVSGSGTRTNPYRVL